MAGPSELSKLKAKLNDEIKTLNLDKIQKGRWYDRCELVLLAFENDGAGSHHKRPCPGCKMIIRKTGGCNAMKCPKCACEFDWLSGDTKDGELGYLSLFYHMDTTSKPKAYWSGWPQMTLDWVLTVEMPRKAAS